jgi:hypothetical protein
MFTTDQFFNRYICIKNLIMFKTFSSILIFICMASFSFAQEKSIFQGYSKDVSGNSLSYHSPLPDVSQSLLVRSHPDYHTIAWETEMIPKDYNGKSIKFVWMYGIDADIKKHDFHLSINGKQILTFHNPPSGEDAEWDFSGANGSTFTLRKTFVDKYEDPMGFATLTIPTNLIRYGEPAVISVSGDNKGENTWYMTFKTAVEESITVKQNPVAIKTKGEPVYSLSVKIVSLYQKKGILNWDEKKQFIELLPGYNSFDLQVNASAKPYPISVNVQIDGENPVSKQVIVEPIREWTLYFVQHSHTDIGYTRPQSEILPEHLRYIDYALDFCDQTDAYPEDAKFRWTCEASWPVLEYLESRPAQQIDRLIKRINEGRIEITGMYFNYSEIADEAGLAAQTRYLKNIKPYGIPIETAMQNDVNGFAWGLTEFFPDAGIKYISMGTHGHRALIPFDKPTAFWWESPSGKKTLAYRGEHYMHGNVLGIHTGNLEVFESNVMNYLEKLEEKGYPFDRATIQYSGYVTDNSPPSTYGSELARAWNEKYEWPKMRIATAKEFLEYVANNHKNDIESLRVAWTDWWSDGCGSAPFELAANRKNHVDLIATQGLLSMACLTGAKLPVGIAGEIDHINTQILFYDEHTYGSAESVREPNVYNTLEQWGEKSAYVWEAKKTGKILLEKAMGFMQPYIPKSDVPSLVVFNTMARNRSGMMEVYIDHQILPPSKAFRIVDYEGNEMMAQALSSREDGTYWGLWAENIPAMGYRIFRIESLDNYRVPDKKKEFEGDVFENEFYRLTFDRAKGSIMSLYDKELETELLDRGATYNMGEVVAELLSNRTQLEQFKLEHADYKTPEQVKFMGIEEGPIWNSLKLKGQIAGFLEDDGVNIEIRLYNTEKRIELIYDLQKIQNIDPEGMYVAFPFRLENGVTRYEVQGGIIEPGKEQLEGSASDWSTIQNFVSIKNDKAQIVFGSNEVPLVHFGGINTGNFDYIANVDNNEIYSWVYNNYWTTNFRGFHQGELRWKYYMTSSLNTDNSFATNFGWESRIPFLSRVLPAGNSNPGKTEDSFFSIKNENILLVNAKPADDGKGTVLQLRETDGKETVLHFVKPTKAYEVNVFEEDLGKDSKEIKFKAFESKFIRILN